MPRYRRAPQKPRWPYEVNLRHPMAQGLARWWPFAGSEGTSIVREVMVGGDGTLTNMNPTTDWVPGGYGGSALDFNTSTSRVTYPTFSIGTEVSISAWFRTDAPAAANQGLIALRGTLMKVDGSGFNWFPDTNLYVATYSVVWTAGRDYHIGVTQKANAYRMFVDGVLVKSGTVGGNLWDTDQQKNFGMFTSTLWPFDGVISDVRVHTQQIPDEVMAWQGHPTKRWDLLNQRSKRFFAVVAASQSTTPDPVTATWSAITPTTSKSTSPAAVSATWTVIAPTVSKRLTASPATATWSVPTPTVSKRTSPAAVSVTWTTVAPSTSRSTSPNPVTATWTPVAPSLSKRTSPAAVRVTWSVVAPSVIAPIVAGDHLRGTIRILPAVDGQFSAQAAALGVFRTMPAAAGGVEVN